MILLRRMYRLRPKLAQQSAARPAARERRVQPKSYWSRAPKSFFYKNDDNCIAIAFNKSTKRAVTKQEIKKFYNISDDLKQGEHGTQLIDSIYCSTSGFMGNALVELENLNKKRSKDPETKINFNLANFENEIFSSTRC